MMEYWKSGMLGLQHASKNAGILGIHGSLVEK